MDYTGTGNTLDATQPAVVRLLTDSLRYWVEEMHVDGFRFDLASSLARGMDDVNMRSLALQAIEQDPVLSQVKLIAEPWDVGPNGYQVGGFPWNWSEWNGRYRRHHTLVLERGRGADRRVRYARHREQRPLRARRAASVGVYQLYYRARRFYAARFSLV